jgi:hypothetical protein
LNVRAAHAESLALRVGAAIAFTWRSWRAAGIRYFGLAMLIGIAMGLLQGAAGAVAATQLAPWRSFISDFLDYFFLAVWLLPCLAVASAIRTRRWPQWVPYFVAATAAVVVAFVMASVLIVPLIETMIDDATQWPGLTMPVLVGTWLTWPPMVLLAYLATFGYMYAHEVQQRAAALRRVQLDRKRLSREAYEARLRAMQARIDPQFLFDTLDDIRRRYETDAAAAECALDALIAYLRAALPSLARSTSSVRVELALVRAWVEIMSIRSDHRLALDVDGAVAVDDAALPSMVLLPLLADAVRQVQAVVEATVTIRVAASIVGDRLRIEAAADRIRLSRIVAREVVQSVTDRLAAIYGSEALLIVQQAPPFAIVVELPHE